MSYDSLFFLKDIIIALMTFIIIGAFLKIRELKDILQRDKRKQSMPLITMEVNTTDDLGLFLINDSFCYAKNIHIDDLDLVLDYGFRKHLTLNFNSLEFLKPSEKIKLDYRVLDGPNEVSTKDSKSVLNHFLDVPFEMRLMYHNLEGCPFRATIIPEKNHYVIKEVTPLEEKNR